MSKYLLAIDQGTTSSRAIVYNRQLEVVAQAQQEINLYYPKPGWVEQDPEQLWQSVVSCIRQALKQAALSAADIAALGITNQRETTLLWHKDTGNCVYPAIVWQDRRSADYCQQLKISGQEPLLQQKTGLLADPYFSATKLRWLLDNVAGARQQAERGELCFGTVDSYLLWRLTGGNVHATDASNASRTLLFNLQQHDWDNELLTLFNIPRQLLPEIKDNASLFGYSTTDLFGTAIPVLSMIGDQQAALLGQACTAPGMSKSTYGTGCFTVVNTGNKVLRSQHKLLSTLAWQLNGQATYALEGSIFMAGATVQWLRDKLGVIQKASDTEHLASQSHYQQSELLIPAFTGLGAPYWQPEVKAALLGMTRDSGAPQLCAAALLSVAYQSQDLLQAMQSDGINIIQLRVDGGMTVNQWFLHALADICQLKVEPAANSDATALGAAFLAALQLGWFTKLTDISQAWRAGQTLSPQLSHDSAQQLQQRWQRAVSSLLALDLAIQ
ncbi:glycerol kinase GlpK [Rheinheimera fenheensis]|uniref:glycerol kinase GlpK n=1 Tax=Rheinheimera fenheensis TaxID=3152295 RepID=UPI00325CEF4A